MATKISFAQPIRSAFQSYKSVEFQQLFGELCDIGIEPHMYDVCNGSKTTVFIENMKSFGKDRVLVAANCTQPFKAKDEALEKLKKFVQEKKNVVGKVLFKADPAHATV